MLKILGRVTSTNVRKVLWAADEMGLGYEREDWGKPVRDPNVPEFLKLNPNAQVPVIVDDGFVLWDSHAIVRYLAAKAGSDLWPEDLRERGLVDQWLSWVAADLSPAWNYVVHAKLRNTPPNPDPLRIDASIAAWTRHMHILEGHLKEAGSYVANGRFSLADIVHRHFDASLDDGAVRQAGAAGGRSPL